MDQLIKHITAPPWPQFRFEYHAVSRKVFVIRISGGTEFAHICAENIGSESTAHFVVQVWLRGYREGNTPTVGQPVGKPGIITG